jgi:hypothetical protein
MTTADRQWCEVEELDGDAPAATRDTRRVDGYASRLETAEARIAELESAIRDELIRRSLNSLPLKFEFARQRGMTGGLDEVQDWMMAVSDRLKNLVDG